MAKSRNYVIDKIEDQNSYVKITDDFENGNMIYSNFNGPKRESESVVDFEIFMIIKIIMNLYWYII